MGIYVYTGKLGSGKTLCAVGRIQEYLNQNRPVATNLDLNLHKLVNHNAKKCVVYRIPDRPKIHDLQLLGKGNESHDEEKNGLIVLDECAHFLNTRNFQDKERKVVVEWFTMARKLGWDVIFIIQHLNALDKQFRDLFAEHIVYCNRMDRLKLPFYIKPFALMLGFSGRLPKIHRALVMYGATQNAIKVDSYVYQGKNLYSSYDTKQVFLSDYQHGTYTYLPPYFTHGRYHNDWHFTKQKFKETFSNYTLKMRQFFLLGLMSGVLGSTVARTALVNPEQPQEQPQEITQPKQELIEEVEPHIYITGSIMGTYTELYFERDGFVFNPKDEGYKVLVRSPCFAQLIRDRIKTDVFCDSARRRQPATAAQKTAKPSIIAQIAESAIPESSPK
jgi:hypothetical protein